jgi:predicted SAM-dependent methyltransferase
MEMISRNGFFDILEDIQKRSSKEFRLDIGAGGRSDSWTTLDKVGGDYTGDIRTMFAPVYNNKADKDLRKIRNDFALIKLQHIVEHIEWIYQQVMFKWVRSIMSYDGYLYIETPNVDWIIDSYLSVNDYSSEHPDIKEDDPCRLIKWLNFKLYSGCSTNKYKDGCTDGDFHLCMYNQQLLEQVLTDSGFKIKMISAEETLLCLAQK